MKFKHTFTIGIVVAMLGFAAMAQDRVYARFNNNVYLKYEFWDSKEELGFRVFSPIGTQDPCFKEFYKLTKSVESDAILFTTDKKIAGCLNQRFMFPNSDLSAGYVQGALPSGEFTPVKEMLATWKSKGINPSLIMKK